MNKETRIKRYTASLIRRGKISLKSYGGVKITELRKNCSKKMKPHIDAIAKEGKYQLELRKSRKRKREYSPLFTNHGSKQSYIRKKEEYLLQELDRSWPLRRGRDNNWSVSIKDWNKDAAQCFITSSKDWDAKYRNYPAPNIYTIHLHLTMRHQVIFEDDKVIIRNRKTEQVMVYRQSRGMSLKVRCGWMDSKGKITWCKPNLLYAPTNSNEALHLMYYGEKTHLDCSGLDLSEQWIFGEVQTWKFNGADLRKARLMKTDITQKQLQSAFSYEGVKLPQKLISQELLGQPVVFEDQKRMVRH